MSILEDIFAHKRQEVAARKTVKSEADLEQQSEHIAVPPDFLAALRSPKKPQPRLIAEVKHRSPSKGVLSQNFDPVKLAQTYAENGAAAISVLTDEKYFGGSLDFLAAIRDLNLGCPLLRKDFIFDRYQILEAHIAGASAVLLITAMLSDSQLTALIQTTREIGLTPLVEVHTQDELDKSLNAGAGLIGINNRDLHTFTVDLQTTLDLLGSIPSEIVVVSESGIHTPADIARLAAAGVDAVLVGESIVTASDPAAKVRNLSQAHLSQSALEETHHAR